VEDEIDIGRKGESWFANEANRRNLRAQRPDNGDVNGWDYLVEHPVMPASIFTSRTRVKSFVQIKTTSPQYRTPVLSLTAMMKLVETELPAFVLHLHYQDSDVVDQWLYHVDFDLMEKAMLLDRVAREEIEKNPDARPLNKRDFRFAKGSHIARYGGIESYDTLVTDIATQYGGVGKYMSKKQSVRDNFRDQSERLSIKMRHPSLQGLDIYSLIAGNKETTLGAGTTSLNLSRKQIMLDGEAMNFENGVVTFRRHPDTNVRVTITSERGRRIVEEVPYWEFINPDRTKKGGKVNGRHFDLSWEYHGSKTPYALSLKSPEYLTISEWAEMTRIQGVLLVPGATLVIEDNGRVVEVFKLDNLDTAICQQSGLVADFAKFMHETISDVYGPHSKEYLIDDLNEQAAAQRESWGRLRSHRVVIKTDDPLPVVGTVFTSRTSASIGDFSLDLCITGRVTKIYKLNELQIAELAEPSLARGSLRQVIEA
jgi:hypothetical protein